MFKKPNTDAPVLDTDGKERKPGRQWDYDYEKRQLQKLNKIQRYYDWGGSRLPFFSLQSQLAHTRNRLKHPGMSDADRANRMQFLEDQKLSPREPVEIPEANPRNIFRRSIRWPWDKMALVLRPILREPLTSYVRFTVPKLIGIYGFTLFIYYHMKYGTRTWERNKGFVFVTHPKSEDEIANAVYDDYYDLGFKNRTALLDIEKTSSTSEISTVDPLDGVPNPALSMRFKKD